MSVKGAVLLDMIPRLHAMDITQDVWEAQAGRWVQGCRGISMSTLVVIPTPRDPYGSRFLVD